MTTQAPGAQKLAIYGGAPACRHPDPSMFPGGMIIAEEEEAAVLEVLHSKRLFRSTTHPDPSP